MKLLNRNKGRVPVYHICVEDLDTGVSAFAFVAHCDKRERKSISDKYDGNFGIGCSSKGRMQRVSALKRRSFVIHYNSEENSEFTFPNKSSHVPVTFSDVL